MKEQCIGSYDQYLHKTKNLGIAYDGNKGFALEGYSNADHGAGENGKLKHWKLLGEMGLGECNQK